MAQHPAGKPLRQRGKREQVRYHVDEERIAAYYHQGFAPDGDAFHIRQRVQYPQQQHSDAATAQYKPRCPDSLDERQLYADTQQKTSCAQQQHTAFERPHVLPRQMQPCCIAQQTQRTGRYDTQRPLRVVASAVQNSRAEQGIHLAVEMYRVFRIEGRMSTK